jgi:uncharacterized protein (DUF849 family)
MSKTIISVAVTGAWPKKKDNPAIPLTPAEIVEDVNKCWKAGAAIAHMHMRDDEGNGTMSTDKFRETEQLLKSTYPECDIILNYTTSGDLNATDETRMAHLIELKPDMASYDCGTMNWGHNALFINHPKFLEKLGEVLIENNIKPEVEIFDAGMFYNSRYYVKKNFLKEPVHYQFVLGAAGGSTATVENLVYLKSLLPENCTWSTTGIGRGHMPILYATIAMGGHVRVGLEDNVMYNKTDLATGNVQLIERAARAIREFGNEVATVAEARELLGLQK